MKPLPLVLACAAAVSAVLALAGCAGEPVPAVTVTATVTATPSPAPRAASDPLTKLDAWAACFAAVSSSLQSEATDAIPKWYPYSDDAVTANADGSFHMQIGFPAGEGSAVNECDASGTVGSPKVILGGFTDI